jgi:hypothetical protein
VSESPPPQDADNAVRAFILLFALGFVLRGIDVMDHDMAGAIAKWFIAAVISVFDFNYIRIRNTLGTSFAATAAKVGTDFRWWVSAILVVLLWGAISPLIERQRWPFSVRSEPRTVSIPAPMASLAIDRKENARISDAIIDLSQLISSDAKPVAVALNDMCLNLPRDMLYKNESEIIDADNNYSRQVDKLVGDFNTYKDKYEYDWGSNIASIVGDYVSIFIALTQTKGVRSAVRQMPENNKAEWIIRTITPIEPSLCSTSHSLSLFISNTETAIQSKKAQLKDEESQAN